jgi:protein O-GlcNAcase/histone acetyltransferase
MSEQRAKAGRDNPRGGVIEGFYGRPWSGAERLTLFGWMRDAGLVDYLHAPKDDPLHRSRWREPYDPAAAAGLGDLVASCHDHGLSFIWALSPGLDIRYASAVDVDHLLRRVGQVTDLGVGAVALLFDDIPGELAAGDAMRFGSLAVAQAGLANAVHARLADTVPGSRLLVCPTPYCGRMAARGLGGTGYLAALGTGLAPGIDLLWTGPEIVSPTISVEHVAGLERTIGRRPVIWDNLYADDYDGSRFFVGPFAGRPALLRDHVGGILLNAANELPLNVVPIHSLGGYLHGGDAWEPDVSHRAAIRAWLPQFTLTEGRIDAEELTLLADCFHLPHAHGAGAKALLAGVPGLLERPPHAWGPIEEESLRIATVLRGVCERLPFLVDRALFHALFRRIWDLREELSLLLQRVENRRRTVQGSPPLPEDEHLAGTFRGGLLADLRRAVPFPPADIAGGPAGSLSLPLLRPARPDDEAATSLVCLRTGDEGADGTALFAADPDALARIYVWPYLALEPGLAWVLEDDEGVCGYCLGALDSRTFHARAARDWQPHLVERFPEPVGAPEGWTAVQRVHWLYHHPDAHCPEPYERYPAHLHIDLLPRVQGRGLGRRMVLHMLAELSRRGAPGVHLAVANGNLRGQAFYRRLGFTELEHRPGPDGCLFMGLPLPPAD